MNWFGFTIAFFLTVILPVWIFNLAPISFFYKIAFTIAGAVGVWLAIVMRGDKR